MMNAFVDVTNIRLETDRLYIRPWHDTDLADFYAYASIPGVGECAGWCHHQSMEESKIILDHFISGKKTLALELKENGNVVGSLGLEELDLDPVGEGKFGREIGYVLSKAYWGRGLMTEAVRTVINYCFRVLNFDYLTCAHFAHNDRSRRVIEKCGFIFLSKSQYETRYDTMEESFNYVLHNPGKKPVDLTQVYIQTPRLVLRAWRESDLQDLFDYSRIPEVGKMAGWPALQTLEEAQQVLDSFIQEPYTFALEHKETGKVIGSLCMDWLDPDPELPDANVLIYGYDLHKAFWGQGLMPEAVKAAVPYCFESLGADYIRIGVYVWNTQSQRVAQKCGFHYWKTWDVSLKNGKIEKEHLYLLPNPKK